MTKNLSVSRTVSLRLSDWEYIHEQAHAAHISRSAFIQYLIQNHRNGNIKHKDNEQIDIEIEEEDSKPDTEQDSKPLDHPRTAWDVLDIDMMKRGF